MIVLDDVGLRRGKSELLSGLTLSVAAQEAIVISGPTGSGKTALLDLLAGRLVCDAGRVEVMGRDTGKLRSSSRERLRRWVAVAPQESIFIEEQTALDNVVVACEVAGVPRASRGPRAVELLCELSLGHLADARCNELSSGQRSLLAVARSFALEPRVILADEPCARLTPDITELVTASFERRREMGAAIVVTGNDADLVAAALRSGWRHYHLIGGGLCESRYSQDRVFQDDVVVPFPTAMAAASSGVR